MTYLRTFAAITLAAISFSTTATADALQGVRSERIAVVATEKIEPDEPLPGILTTDIINGVRIVADTVADRDRIASAIQRFESAGWPLTNLEVRVSGEEGCGGNAGTRSVTNGHDLVELCTNTQFVLLHELGHVWSSRYLDSERRAAWLELRGLTSWSDADYSDRGTEQAAIIIAFGLLDTWHTPMAIAPNDRESLIEGFTWLFGMEPLHMARTMEQGASSARTVRSELGIPSTRSVRIPS